jgi:acetyl esterase/lipase
MLRFFAAFLALTFVSACGGTQLLNSVAVNPGKIERDIAYGTLPRQKLDVYSPKEMKTDTPTLVFFHGGSWQYGSKDDYRFLGTAFAARGIQTVVVNYRLHPEVIFPAFVEDAAKALAFTKASISKGRPMFVSGHSAGAHIAAMVSLDPRFLATEGTSICDTAKGIIGISGPYEFTPIDPEFKLIFPAAILPSTKPINFAATRAPPTLLLHGTADTTVLPSRSTDMMNAMVGAGNQVEVKMYPGVNHTYIIGAISPVVRRSAPTLADMVGFIDAQKAAGNPGCAPVR